jgi:hypothetical protein
MHDESFSTNDLTQHDVQSTSQTTAGWADAYAAFQGAFDTPVARRLDGSEFAQDARRRLREFNAAMTGDSSRAAAHLAGSSVLIQVLVAAEASLTEMLRDGRAWDCDTRALGLVRTALADARSAQKSVQGPTALVASEDTEILDWYEKNHQRVNFAIGMLNGPSSWSFFDGAGTCHTGYATVRDAVRAAVKSDAAMA